MSVDGLSPNWKVPFLFFSFFVAVRSEKLESCLFEMLSRPAFNIRWQKSCFLEWHPDSFHVCAYSWMPVCLICFPGLYSILVLAGLGACCPTLFTSWCRGWFRSAWCGTACWGWSCCEKSTSCHSGKRCPASRSCWPSGCWAAGSRWDLRTSDARQSTSGGRTRPWCTPAQKFRVEGFYFCLHCSCWCSFCSHYRLHYP